MSWQIVGYSFMSWQILGLIVGCLGREDRQLDVLVARIDNWMSWQIVGQIVGCLGSQDRQLDVAADFLSTAIEIDIDKLPSIENRLKLCFHMKNRFLKAVIPAVTEIFGYRRTDKQIFTQQSIYKHEITKILMISIVYRNWAQL